MKPNPDFASRAPLRHPVLNGLALLGLVLVFGCISISWSELPSQVPTHFGFSGPPNGFGPKAAIWTLPCVAVFLYLLLTLTCRHPELASLPASITEEQRGIARPQIIELLGWVRAEVMWMFAWLTWTTVQVALGRSSGLSAAFGPVTLGSILLTPVVFWLRIRAATAPTS